MNNTVPTLCVQSISFDNEWPDRMSIQFPRGLDIVIIRTPEGYVADAYSADGQLISTLNVWDDDLGDEK